MASQTGGSEVWGLTARWCPTLARRRCAPSSARKTRTLGCMPMTLRALVDKVDSVSERALLWATVALSCFVGIAHGGALAITYAKPTPDPDSIRQLASISLPLAAIIFLTSVGALVRVDFR